jgi:ribosomal protein L28
VIRVYDQAGNVIETHEHSRRVWKLALASTHFDVPATEKRVLNESR